MEIQMSNLINTINNLFFKYPETYILFVRKIIIFPLILSILATMAGCKNSTKEETGNAQITTTQIDFTTNDLASLQIAQAKWKSKSGQYYTIQTQRNCECLPEMSSQMKVSVLDNSVLSAVDINSDEVISTAVIAEITTVDDLFTLIEKAIADSITIEVTYHEEFGYPEITKIGLEQLAVDGGLHITLSNLELQDSQLALDDVTWTLVSFDSIAGPLPVIKNTHISLSIDLENRQLHGIAGCNNYSAAFVLDDENHNIIISDIISTEMWCDSPEENMQQEQNYLATLAQIRFFTFDKMTLNMIVGGDAGLHFIAGQGSVEQTENDTSSNDLASLQSARKKWQSNTKQYYTIQSQRICFCMPEMSAHMKINVLDSSILSATDINSGAAISKNIQNEVKTVDDLFNLIEQAIADDTSIEITYNEEYGYPETTKINLEQIAVDGGLHINLSNVELLDAKLALSGVTWILESFDNIAGPQPLIKGTNISLSIDMERGQISGNGGCNNYSADFVLNNENHDMTISNVISTEMACSAPENIMQQEQNYFSTLEQIRFFSFNKATLNMVIGADAGFHFVPID
jgi:heat shock protein HslJ